MMGVVFIGALCAHDERIRQGTSGEYLLEKIQQQVNKKFGAKGPEVVRSNMLVLKERYGIHSGGRLPPPGIHRNHSF